jgi:hypothetical protein
MQAESDQTPLESVVLLSIFQLIHETRHLPALILCKTKLGFNDVPFEFLGSFLDSVKL